MSDFFRGAGWLLSGVVLTMVTDGFGTFTRPKAPLSLSSDDSGKAPLVATPGHVAVQPCADEVDGGGLPSGGRLDASTACSRESILALQKQIGQLEQLLSERRTRGRSRDEPDPTSDGPLPTSPQGANFAEDLLAQQQLSPRGETAEMDAEMQREVLKVVKDLQRQIESGQLDHQKRVDEVMKNNK